MIHPPLVLRRMRNQHLAEPVFSAPADVVRWLGAVQAQDFPAALYAVGLRMKPATADVVEQAIPERSILRTWPMRGTLHFVPPEDAQWMTRLLAHRVNVKSAGQYRKAGLAAESFARARKVIMKALRAGAPVMRKDLVRLLKEAGVASARGLTGLFLLLYWAQEGLICLGPREGKQPTFVLLDEWVPRPRSLDADEALATIAQRYFASHGPATVQDFAWWTGLTLAEARRAVDACGQYLVNESFGDSTHWSSQDAPGDATAEKSPRSSLVLLQSYDELTVAYKDRSAFLDPGLKEEAASGIGPGIFINGRLAGTWRRAVKGKAVSISFRLFTTLPTRYHGELEAAARNYGRFFGKEVVFG